MNELMIALKNRNDFDGGNDLGWWWCRLDGERIHLMKGNCPYLASDNVEDIVRVLTT